MLLPTLFALVLQSVSSGDETPAVAPTVRSVAERWAEWSDEERARFLENAARWRALDEEERVRMKARHRSLENWRDRVEGESEPESGAPATAQDPEERRREIERRTSEVLRRLSRSLSEEARQGLRAELRSASPKERAERTASWIREELARRFPDSVDRLVQKGAMTAERGQDLERRFREAGPLERHQILRRLVQSHPRELRVPPEVLNAVGPEDDGAESSSPLRILERLRGPRMSREVVLLYLERRGVPRNELDRLGRARPSDFEAAVERLCRRHEVESPAQLSRRLRARGVAAERLSRTLEDSSAEEAVQRLLEWADSTDRRRP